MDEDQLVQKIAEIAMAAKGKEISIWLIADHGGDPNKDIDNMDIIDVRETKEEALDLIRGKSNLLAIEQDIKYTPN